MSKCAKTGADEELHPAIFLDRDGTIVDDRGDLSCPAQVVFYADTVSALLRLGEYFELFIVTNQSGVAKGALTMQDVERVNTHIVERLAEKGIRIAATYVCPHARVEDCQCIKPNPYFLQKAADDHRIDLRRSFVIGDHPHDVALAIKAGAEGIYVLTGHGTKHRGELGPCTTVATGIGEAAELILAKKNRMVKMRYIEKFDDGPGGWYAWISNAAGPKPLEVRGGAAISRSPWWIDYNHAPPGAGYMHLLYMLNTRGSSSEHQREVAGENRFIKRGISTNFSGARIKLRLKGELEARGAQLVLLCQAVQGGICSGWLLTGRPFRVTPDWSEQTVAAAPDPALWTCLGSRHDRRDFYGRLPLSTVLRDVNANILFVLFPLTIAPMGPLAGDPHRLRPEKDYPVWRSRLPEGYVMLDEVRIDFA